jgi:hypothetical protein
MNTAWSIGPSQPQNRARGRHEPLNMDRYWSNETKHPDSLLKRHPIAFINPFETQDTPTALVISRLLYMMSHRPLDLTDARTYIDALRQFDSA